jgi:hypothetical protein
MASFSNALFSQWVNAVPKKLHPYLVDFKIKYNEIFVIPSPP